MNVKQKLLLLLGKIVFYALIAIGILFVVRLLFNQSDNNFLLFDLRIGLGEQSQMEEDEQIQQIVDSERKGVDPDDQYIESILPKNNSNEDKVFGSGDNQNGQDLPDGTSEQDQRENPPLDTGDEGENSESSSPNSVENTGNQGTFSGQGTLDDSSDNPSNDEGDSDTTNFGVSYSLSIHGNSGVIYTKPGSPQYRGYPLAKLQSHTNFTKEPEETLAEYSENISTQGSGGVEYSAPTEYRMDSSGVFRPSSFYN